MPPSPQYPDWSGRLAAVREDCVKRNLDALAISGLVNIRYLCGFEGSTAILLVSSDAAWLISDGRYDTSVREALGRNALGPIQLERVERRYDLSLAALAVRLGIRRAGFEAQHVTVSTLRNWQQASPGIDWVSTEGVVEQLRMIKDAGEVQALRVAARRLSDVARGLGEIVAAGRTERDIAKDIDTALERHGFSGPAFPTIVAGGPNSALPHARPSTRTLVKGDLVLLDFGGVLDGYCVDLTRMAGIGPVESRAADLFVAVRDAQSAAIGAIRAGVLGADVDAAARRVLDDRGLGSAFLHSTGHGLGLEVHEGPRLARADSGAVDRLEAGSVCTVEPGAYLAGFGGVRLEDDVLVTAAGCEVLTDAPRDLLIV